VAFLGLDIKYKTTKATIFEEYKIRYNIYKIKLIVKVYGQNFFFSVRITGITKEEND
jgi:hypothetical protein